ncbi:MAG TPA: hypothetical protein VN755_05635, partial [Steroidobacteraceae bacterium]|nr:hypothetical protein [Steroidobacteraceae bacterium]
VIDVIAGFTLATLAAVLSPKITRWEVARREARDLGQLVPAFQRDTTRISAPDSVGRAAA